MTGSAKTEVMCHLLRNKLREIGHTGDLTFYCDIAGSANRPEASRSNIAIIQEAFPAARIETRHIANIADRITATNARFCDSKGKQVKNWKQKMQGVWFKEENKTKQTSINEHLKMVY